MRAIRNAVRRPLVPAWWPALICLLLPLPSLGLPTGKPFALGGHLTYIRVQRLPADAAALAKAWTAPALIVDLRYPRGDPADALPADLPPRPRADPLFVLVSPDTPAVLLDKLRRLDPALITFGPGATRPEPDIALEVTPEDDRKAYDAFADAASVKSLYYEKNTNVRFDEAALAREHAEDPEGNDTMPPPPPPEKKDKPGKPPVIDHVLRRAVQLDHALLALNKLPAE